MGPCTALLKQLDGAGLSLGCQAAGSRHEHHGPAIILFAGIGAEVVVVIDLDQGRGVGRVRVELKGCALGHGPGIRIHAQNRAPAVVLVTPEGAEEVVAAQRQLRNFYL